MTLRHFYIFEHFESFHLAYFITYLNPEEAIAERETTLMDYYDYLFDYYSSRLKLLMDISINDNILKFQKIIIENFCLDEIFIFTHNMPEEFWGLKIEDLGNKTFEYATKLTYNLDKITSFLGNKRLEYEFMKNPEQTQSIKKDYDKKTLSLFKGQTELIELFYYLVENFEIEDNRATKSTKFNQLYFYINDCSDSSNLNKSTYKEFIQEHFLKTYNPIRINGNNQEHQFAIENIAKIFNKNKQ